MVSKVRRPEEALQRAVVQHLEVRAMPGVEYTHPANGGFRTKAEAGILKAMGMRPGASDLLIWRPVCWFGALELKAQGRKPTGDQISFGEAMARCGFEWQWADNLDDALGILELWGVIRPDANAKAGVAA